MAKYREIGACFLQREQAASAMHAPRPLRAAILVGTLFLLLSSMVMACRRHEAAAPLQRPLLSFEPIDERRLRPGPLVDDAVIGGPAELPGTNPYEGNMYAIQDGFRLYRWMNCNGCHAEGGGGIGPPLWDEQWIYGGSPAQIAESILRGRPEGMPAYGGRLPLDQVWRIVAYLQALTPDGVLVAEGQR